MPAVRAILVICLLFGFAAHAVERIPPRPKPKAKKPRVVPVPIDPYAVMTDKQLGKELASLVKDRARLQREIDIDVRNRLWKIGWMKYAKMQAVISDTIGALREMQKRETDFMKRIRLKRRIDALRREIIEINGVRDLLKLRG